MFHSIQSILEAKNLSDSGLHGKKDKKILTNSLFPLPSNCDKKKLIKCNQNNNVQNLQMEQIPNMLNAPAINTPPAILNNPNITAAAFLSDPVIFACRLFIIKIKIYTTFLIIKN